MKRLVTTATRQALLLGVLAAIVGCESKTAVGEQRLVVRLTDNSSLSHALALEYRHVFPEVDVQVVNGNIETIQRGDADLGFALADWAHLEHRPQPADAQPTERVRGVAVFLVAPLTLLVRETSGVHRITDLRGKRVRVGMPRTGDRPFAGSGLLAETVLRAFGVHLDDLHAEQLDVDAMIAGFNDGTLDALFTTPYYPTRTFSAMTGRGARLLPIEGPVIAKLRQEYPFIRPVVIPPNTYVGQTDPIRSVGVDSLLVCRGDLDEGLVYDLTRHFFEAVQRLAVTEAGLRGFNVNRASATPIPLHPGAARYYREWELFR